MSKEEMIQARELIKQKRYEEARVILRKTSHPKAAEWLAKLDEIDPPVVDEQATLIEPFPYTAEFAPTPSPSTAAPPPKPKETERVIPMPVVIGCLGFLLLAVVCTIGTIYVGSKVANVFGGVATFFLGFSDAPDISYNSPVTSSLSDENFHQELWDFQATEGERLIIIMRSNSFDTYLSVYSEDGDLIAEDDDTGGGANGTDSQIQVTIPTDGRYVILAEQYDLSEEGGAYTLMVQR
ncbi:MAG: pre-peptidase C-terminal domain-containing protein [Candidatus Promineifilaceae bacterium]